jgi:hypothetical protein
MACLKKMSFSGALAGAVILQLASSLAARAGDDRWQWTYCAPPYPPACAEAPAKEGKARTACEQAAEAYVAAVFAYRACLTNEMERAVREANKVIQSLKCPTDARFCYDSPRAPEAPR